LKWVPQLEQEFHKAWWDFRDAIIDHEYSQEFDKQLTDCQAKEGFGDIVLQKW